MRLRGTPPYMDILLQALGANSYTHSLFYITVAHQAVVVRMGYDNVARRACALGRAAGALLRYAGPLCIQ